MVKGNNGETVGYGGGRFRDGWESIGGVGPWASKVLQNHVLELFEGNKFKGKLPVEILAHFKLHLVNVPELKHTLTND